MFFIRTGRIVAYVLVASGIGLVLFAQIAAATEFEVAGRPFATDEFVMGGFEAVFRGLVLGALAEIADRVSRRT